MSTPETATPPLQLILSALPAELVKQAVVLAVEQMALTPEKLATILVRHFNPDEIIEKGREAKLRGVKPDTLRAYKEEGYFPEFVNASGRARR